MGFDTLDTPQTTVGVDGCAAASIGLPLPEWLLDIWNRCTDEFLSFEELAGLPIPAPYTPRMVWDFVAALKKHAGVLLPYKLYLPIARSGALPDGPSRDVWYFQSRAMISEMNVVAELSKDSSRLNGLIAKHLANPVVLLSLVADEMVYVLRRDGIEITREDAQGIWLHSVEPRTEEQTVFRRLCDLFLDAHRYASRPITRGLFESIEEALSWDLSLQPGRHSRLDSYEGYVTYPPETAFDIICSLMGGGCPDVMPILALRGAEVFVWDHAPLRAFNYTVGFLLRRICSERMGHPALAYTPFSLLSNVWHEGLLDKEARVIPFDITQGMHVCSSGYDSTAYQMALLQLDHYALDLLQRRLEHFGRIEGLFAEELDADARVNERQRRFLVRLFFNPLSRTTIPEYCEEMSVAYSTARNDLQSMAEMGYLAEGYDSRACVFTPGKAIAKMLRRAILD